MFRNYLLITFRNFKGQKLFSLLNIFGLALGLASAILIFLYVNDELRYDTMQPYYKDTWRVGCTFINPDGQRFDNTVAPGYFIRYLKDNRSEVLKATRSQVALAVLKISLFRHSFSSFNLTCPAGIKYAPADTA